MRKIFMTCFATLLLVACNNDDLVSQEKDTNEIQILKERDPNSPLILSKKNTISKKSTIPSIPLELQYYLGRSFKDNSIPISSPENISFPILNIEKLYADYPNYIYVKKLNISEAKAFSFSDFNSYEEKSSFTKKVNSGFSLKLGLFSIGSKKTFEEVFSSTKINENKRIFGELNVALKGDSYSLQNSSNINKKYYTYFTNEFMEELYNTHPSELINNYGKYLLVDFVSGGKASALYTGIVNKTSTKEENEKKMDKSISASYGFKMNNGKEGSTSGELGFGKINGSGSSTSSDISNVELAVKTIGGGNGLSGFSSPKNIDDVNINLSSWISTLNDKSTWNIIDINDNGLIPISDFILEENFKKYMEYNSVYKLSEPYIEIAFVQPIQNIFMSIVTRFGDRLIIKKSPVSNQVDRDNKAKIFTDYADSFTGMRQQKGLFQSNNYIVVFDLDFNNMSKFKNPKNNITYLLGKTGNGEKIALSVYDDYLYDTYAIRKWANSLPSTTISENEFLTYRVMGL